jgi:hypothetical protein
MTNSVAARPLPSQRHLFDIPDHVAFLNCAYLSPLPRASVSAGEQGLRRKPIFSLPARPCRRAAEKRDELAAFPLIELHSIPASQGQIAEYRIGEDQSADCASQLTTRCQKHDPTSEQ